MNSAASASDLNNRALNSRVNQQFFVHLFPLSMSVLLIVCCGARRCTDLAQVKHHAQNIFGEKR